MRVIVSSAAPGCSSSSSACRPSAEQAPDALARDPHRHAGRPHRRVQPGAFESVGVRLDQSCRQCVGHQCEWLPGRQPEPLEAEHRRARRERERVGHLVVAGPHRQVEQASGRVLTGAGEIVMQAGQFQRAPDRRHDHLGTDAPLAHQQALVHQVGDRLPQRRSRQVEVVGQVEFVRNPVAGVELAAGDRVLDLPRHLQVQGNRTRTVDGQRQFDRLRQRHGPRLAPAWAGRPDTFVLTKPGTLRTRGDGCASD